MTAHLMVSCSPCRLSTLAQATPRQDNPERREPVPARHSASPSPGEQYLTTSHCRECGHDCQVRECYWSMEERSDPHYQGRYSPQPTFSSWLAAADEGPLSPHHHSFLFWLRIAAAPLLASQLGHPEPVSLLALCLEAWWILGVYLVAASCSCLLYTSPSPRDGLLSRMPSSA